jgi:hypothetical protein
MQVDTAKAIYNEFPESSFVGRRGSQAESSVTALAYVFSAGGFAIGADGLNVLNTEGHYEITSHKVQKIFPIKGAGREAAYSLMGRVTLYKEISDKMPAFNFATEFGRAVLDINHQVVKDAGQFIYEVCSIVQRRLRVLKEQGGLRRYPSSIPSRLGQRGSSIVGVFVDGYFNDAPYRAGARFFHDNQELGFEYLPHSLDRASRIHLLGSLGVERCLSDARDTRLREHRTEAYQWGLQQESLEITTLTLDDAIEMARNYIAACSDRAAIEVDQFCEWLGGCPQIAAITPKGGFEWISRPDEFDPL